MEIKEMASILKLSYIRECYDLLLNEANHLSLSHRDFLVMALERELEKRLQNGINRRIRNAKFNVKKYMEDFIKEKYEPDIRNKFKEIETMNVSAQQEGALNRRTSNGII